MSLHLELKERLEQAYAARLPEGVALHQDALLMNFDTGLALEARFASAEEYTINWLWGDARLRIDTAPLHPELATCPNHFHDVDEQVRPDPLTRPGASPWENLGKVIDALLVDPLLQS
ncbi:conserved protein of unknown function [Sterolibacterium denitrificans]|uniref:Uncharacterized protein n=1 Tax=Sterolibacterium denitrificans TaxID=157592 RepID=A0A7Z7HS26_9PROT|nr:hypothetical protein [Sterolibacterium denitrificans]SMB27029.1 conserved protein of unknown function [Sterolibacterium denitrificans]